jgi:hypothetical protein
MNGNPLTLPEALRDRFPVTIHVDEIHPDALARIPTDLQKLAAATVLSDDSERRMSIRKWIEYSRLKKIVKDEDLVAHALFGHRKREVLDGIRVAGSSRVR